MKGRKYMQFKSIERVLFYFEEISKIPHGSYNVDKISDYLVSFAKNHNLKYVQDEFKNVIIYKDATKGYENESGIVIQGHMDMVAVKTASSDKDMEKEGLDLVYDGKYLFAKDTSLGADDGIAVAYALAILEAENISHPALEVLITTNEEVGMDGAIGLDPENIKGRRLLNIDSEEEGILTVGCAGGTRVDAELGGVTKKAVGNVYKIIIDGLLGGHSGTMIHLERANANVLMGRVLERLIDKSKLNLISINGGEKTNAITPKSEALVVSGLSYDEIENIISNIQSEIKDEYHFTDPDINISVTEENGDYTCFPEETTFSAMHLLVSMPDGVISHDGQYREMVDTSLNVGVVKTINDKITFSYEIRSSVASKMKNLVMRVNTIGARCGAKMTEKSSYPEWQPRTDSKLKNVMASVYEKQYGKPPYIEIVHAGLECGVLSKKLEGLDAVSYGPDILDIHTTNEKLDLLSTERVWEFTLEVLKQKY